MALNPVELWLEGSWVSSIEPNQRWAGRIRPSAAFATLVLIATPRRLFWAKAEVAHSAMPITLDIQPTRGDYVQYIFIAGSGWIQDFVAEVPGVDARPAVSLPSRMAVGVIHTLFTLKALPPAKFQLLFLASADIHAGRTGVWRPHATAVSFLPTHLAPVFSGGRSGSIPLPFRREHEASDGPCS